MTRWVRAGVLSGVLSTLWASVDATPAPTSGPSRSPSRSDAQPEPPRLVPSGGIVTSGSNVTVIAAAGTAVWYQVGGGPVLNLDGSVRRGALRYTRPVSVGDGFKFNSTIDATFTLRAASTWACCELELASQEVIGEYTVLPRTPPPTFQDLLADSGTEYATLTLNSTGQGAIYYVLGDTATLDPEQGLGIRYTEPLLLGVGQTLIRAKAWSPPNAPSFEVQRTYTIAPRAVSPVIMPAAGCSLSAGRVDCIAPGELRLMPDNGESVYYTLCQAVNDTDAEMMLATGKCAPFKGADSGTTALYSSALQFTQPASWALSAVVGATDSGGTVLSLSLMTQVVVDVRARSGAIALTPPGESVVLVGSLISVGVAAPPTPRGTEFYYRLGRGGPVTLYEEPGIPVNESWLGNRSIEVQSRRAGWMDGPWLSTWYLVVPEPPRLLALAQTPFERNVFAARVAVFLGCWPTCQERVEITDANFDGPEPDHVLVSFRMLAPRDPLAPSSDTLSERLITATEDDYKDRLKARVFWPADAARPPATADDDDSSFYNWWAWAIIVLAFLVIALCIALLLCMMKKGSDASEKQRSNDEPGRDKLLSPDQQGAQDGTVVPRSTIQPRTQPPTVQQDLASVSQQLEMNPAARSVSPVVSPRTIQPLLQPPAEYQSGMQPRARSYTGVQAPFYSVRQESLANQRLAASYAPPARRWTSGPQVETPEQPFGSPDRTNLYGGDPKAGIWADGVNLNDI